MLGAHARAPSHAGATSAIGRRRDSLYSCAVNYVIRHNYTRGAVSHDALGPDTEIYLMVFAPDAPRVAWLFTRGDKSVRMEATAAQVGARLVVKGPGSKRVAYDFPDLLALIEHQKLLETQLVEMGFALEQFNSERRRWPR